MYYLRLSKIRITIYFFKKIWMNEKEKKWGDWVWRHQWYLFGRAHTLGSYLEQCFFVLKNTYRNVFMKNHTIIKLIFKK